MASTSLGVRERIVAASTRIGRVKRIDRAARALIIVGGIFIIISVLFIFLFIAAETVPLFPRSDGGKAVIFLRSVPRRRRRKRAARLAIGVDEYQKYIYPDPPRRDRRLLPRRQRRPAPRDPDPGPRRARLTAASRSLQGDFFAAGTDDGRVALFQVRFRPVFEGQVLADLDDRSPRPGRSSRSTTPRARCAMSATAESPDGEKIARGSSGRLRHRARAFR